MSHLLIPGIDASEDLTRNLACPEVLYSAKRRRLTAWTALFVLSVAAWLIMLVYILLTTGSPWMIAVAFVLLAGPICVGVLMSASRTKYLPYAETRAFIHRAHDLLWTLANSDSYELSSNAHFYPKLEIIDKATQMVRFSFVPINGDAIKAATYIVNRITISPSDGSPALQTVFDDIEHLLTTPDTHLEASRNLEQQIGDSRSGAASTEERRAVPSGMEPADLSAAYLTGGFEAARPLIVEK